MPALYRATLFRGGADNEVGCVLACRSTRRQPMKTVRYYGIAIFTLITFAIVAKAAALESDQVFRADLALGSGSRFAGFKVTTRSSAIRQFQRFGQAHARHGI